jgi:hypothetical protein
MLLVMSVQKLRFWGWFGAWVLAGGLLIFSVLDVIGFGLFTLPLAIVAVWLLAARGHRWPQALGLVPGSGIVLLLLAWANRDYQVPCSPGIVLGSGGYSSCGGVPPSPVFAAGLLIVAAGVAVYAIVSRTRSPARLNMAIKDPAS